MLTKTFYGTSFAGANLLLLLKRCKPFEHPAVA